ncbi:GNAT family N-acetyltransferase [Luteipulveratus sp. YIM 133132]|uniref:GNAT family N-acetyltransferase n=1 Tax=Luteipulveratus flavus TaxID=3031728 RepID=UPI0023AFF935|nr:GNAT family N-acetyltransferase [Luteipulveratus sp. YIM 133132]MDE9366753.1 GNAT family N-acetyltransferase [Luteipulveratus sp. YIM 133132]
MVAWAYADTGAPAYLDLHVEPSARPEVRAEVMAWVGTLGPVVVPVLDRERHLRTGLEHLGARESAGSAWFVHQHRPLAGALPQALLPRGYRIRSVRSDDVEARVLVHRRSWAPARVLAMAGGTTNGRATESSFDREAYDRVTATTLYRRDLDLVVEASDGRLVASALGWFDPVSRSGLIEPVGTDPSYAVRGLGRAACAALLVALARAGAQGAVVCPRGDDAYPVPRHLYGTLGMRAIGRTRTYVLGSVGGAS